MLSTVLTLAIASASTPLTAGEEDTATPSLSAAEPERAAPAPIRNGVVEEGYPSAVGLGAFTFTACSGSLITPRIVLSAAHCGGDFSPEAIVSIGKAFFGTTPATAEQEIGFEEWVPHPDYEPLGETVPQTLPVNDVGIVVLSEDVVGIEPVWVRTDAMVEGEIGVRLTSVGYGATDESGGGSGTKRSGLLTIDRLDGQFIISNTSTNPDGSQICSGDSGGPMYFEYPDGTLEQWAVHSYGDQNCTLYSGSTRTDLVADFILEQVERVHGTRDLCEINGRYDDGVCDATCIADPDCGIDAEEGVGCACATGASAPNRTWLLAGWLAAVLLRRRP